MAEFATRNGVPQCTLQNYNDDFADRHTVHGVVAHWAREKPDAVAIVNAETRQAITWQRFDQVTTALAMQLLKVGLRRATFWRPPCRSSPNTFFLSTPVSKSA
jgi:non-ribosomal peptide synthetase component E (peptide arylation enzyme)